MNWEKLKNPTFSLRIGRNLKVLQPTTNTHSKNPNFESMGELGNVMS